MGVISNAEAIGMEWAFKPQPFEPEWTIYVRPRGDAELRPITEWTGPISDWRVENPRLGKLESCTVTNGAGRPMWDQFRATETGGAVVVPYSIDAAGVVRVLLQTEFRHIVKDRDGHDGRFLLAAPRGWGSPSEGALKTAIRELAEEAGYDADTDSAQVIGETNANTTFFATSVPIVAVRVDPRPDSVPIPDAAEPVIKVRQMTIEELLDAELLCGFTQTALFSFLRFATKQEFLRISNGRGSDG